LTVTDYTEHPQTSMHAREITLKNNIHATNYEIKILVKFMASPPTGATNAKVELLIFRPVNRAVTVMLCHRNSVSIHVEMLWLEWCSGRL